mgnify:CR=1 FL=1
MTFTLAVLWVAAATAVTWLSSAVVALLLSASRNRLDRLSPAAEARVLLVAAATPCFVTLLVMTAALAPNFGWIVDHCLDVSTHAAHPHVCIDHHGAVMPALSLLVLSTLMTLRFAAALSGLARSIWTAYAGARRLERAKLASRRHNVLPLPEPRAFVAGLLRPVVYVTAGLLRPEHRAHFRAVFAHEAAHARSRDPLQRVLVRLAVCFHLPGVAAWIGRRHHRATEASADDRAARSLGPLRVAEALMHLARYSGPTPTGASAFLQAGDLEYRVRRLLRPGPAREQHVRWTWIAALAGTLVVATCLGADGIHHGVEHLLGVLST